MNKACSSEVNQCLPCNDAPIENLSAEGSDLPTFLGIVTFRNDPDLGVTFAKQGCLGWAFSRISIEDAETQAAAQDCPEFAPPPPPGDDNPTPPPEPPPTKIEIDFPCTDNLALDCSTFDCCEGNLTLVPNYTLRPRCQIGAAVTWFTNYGPGNFPIPYLFTETVDRWNGYFEEAVTNQRNFCYWRSADVASAIMQVGNRWELYIYSGQYAVDLPNVPVCSADTGPPFFDCTAIGCAAGTGLVSSVNQTVYFADVEVLYQPYGGDYISINNVTCPTVVFSILQGESEELPPYWCNLWTADGYIFRTCYSSQATPSAPYTRPCTVTINTYGVVGTTPGVVRQYYKGVRNTCGGSGSPRGTYIGDNGSILDNCGNLKAEFTPLPSNATVTLEVPPP